MATTQATVVLTGSTGNLGTYLLHTLARSSSVKTIYCLNRSSSAQEKQRDSLLTHGLEYNDDSVEIIYCQWDSTATKLGLHHDVYSRIQETATHILHSAWPVNWSHTFSTFEPSLKGVQGLISLCSACVQAPVLFFVSSQAVAGDWGAVAGAKSDIPERLITDWRVARFGYGQSKLVAERLIADAHATKALRSAICRVGQVSGPINNGELGIWPTQEWLPSLILTSRQLKGIPASLGLMDEVAWVPVDVVANVIVELLFRSTAAYEKGPLIYHVSNPYTTRWSTLLATITQALGSDVRKVELSEWVDLLQEALNKGVAGDEKDGYPALKLLSYFQSLKKNTLRQPSATVPRLDVQHTVRASVQLAQLPAVKSEWMSLWLRQWASHSRTR